MYKKTNLLGTLLLIEHAAAAHLLNSSSLARGFSQDQNGTATSWPWQQSSRQWWTTLRRNVSTRLWGELHDGPLIAWVRFGGGGDLFSTLQQTFQQRAARDTGKREALCRTRDADVAAEPSRPPCLDQPDLAVIQAEPPYCEVVSAQRPCRYFTALRDPVARMVSKYSSSCLQCAFGGLDCDSRYEEDGLDDQPDNPDLKPLPSLSCPNMSLFDYVRFKGNEYVAEFSGKKRFCQRTGAAKNSSVYRECITEISDIDYEAALKMLRSRKVMAMAPEEGSFNFSMHPGWRLLEEALREELTLTRVTTKPESTYVPTWQEIRQLKNVLKHDIRLYDEVKALQDGG